MASSRFVSLLFALLVVFPAFATALYDASSPVTQLTPDNFKKTIKTGLHIVEFYAPWCGHCKQLAPEFEKLSKATKGLLSVAAVDADAHKQLGGEYGVQGFPTIKAFIDGKPAGDYQGERTAAGIADWGVGLLKKEVQKRVGGGGGKKGGSGGSGSGGGDSGNTDGKDVVALDPSSFKKQVLGSQDLWMVEFFAPWCGHCKKLAPEWSKAATKVKGKVNFGAVDCTVHESLCGQYDVKGFPTIKFFGRDKSSAEEYNGARVASSLVKFAEEQANAQRLPKEAVELTGAAVLEEQCAGNQICLVAFLPHILDSKAAGRNAYLATLKEVARSFIDRPWGYVWVEAGAQPALEQALGVGNFPSAAVVNVKKKAFSLMKTAFSKARVVEESVKDFLSFMPSPAPLAELPEVKTVTPWDGQDGKEELVEEFDLADLMNSD